MNKLPLNPPPTRGMLSLNQSVEILRPGDLIFAKNHLYDDPPLQSFLFLEKADAPPDWAYVLCLETETKMLSCFSYGGKLLSQEMFL